MNRAIRLIVLVAASVILWYLLGFWVVSGSERFYLVVPPACFTGYLLLAEEARKYLVKNLLMCGAAYLVVFCLADVLCYTMIREITESTVGLFHPAVLRESLPASYFLFAIGMLFLSVHQLLRNLARGAETWCLGNEKNSLSRSRAVVRCLGAVVPLVLLLAVSVPYFLAASYIHRVKIPNLQTPRQHADRAYEDVSFVTSDGVTIRAWYIPAQQPSTRTVLICHGLNANRSNFLHYVQVADALRSNVLIFDFRGHGDSDGHTVSLGGKEDKDVLAAADWLRKERAQQSEVLIGLGISMGASSLILAAAEIEQPFEALILDSPYAAPTELTDSVLNGVPPAIRPCLTVPGLALASLEACCRLTDVRPIDAISKVRCPVQFIHAQGDPVIPCEHSRRMYENADEPKALWTPNNRGHSATLVELRHEYLWIVTRFCEEHAVIPLEEVTGQGLNTQRRGDR